MIAAILVSFAMIIVLIAGAAACLGLAVRSLQWLAAQHKPRKAWLYFAIELCVACLWILVVMSASIVGWAILYMWLDLFQSFEAALYFSVVSFTTVGYGDVIIEGPWRLLAGMTAAHGLLSFGLYTAFLVEALDLPVRRRPGSERPNK